METDWMEPFDQDAEERRQEAGGYDQGGLLVGVEASRMMLLPGCAQSLGR